MNDAYLAQAVLTQKLYIDSGKLADDQIFRTIVLGLAAGQNESGSGDTAV